jgi:hypothetical protein
MLRVAGTLAVLGGGATPILVGELLSLDLGQVLQAVEALNGTGVFQDGRFRHPVARAAVLAALSVEERNDLRARAAGRLHRGPGRGPGPTAQVCPPDPTTPATPDGPEALRRPDPATAGVDRVTRALWAAAERAVDDGDADLALGCLRLALRNEADPQRRAVTMAMLAQLRQPEAVLSPGPALRPPPHAGPPTDGGFATMSGAERRVASLAATGYTNRQIASALHITVSTVEQHLTRVYRKLRVCGRADLPATYAAS